MFKMSTLNVTHFCFSTAIEGLSCPPMAIFNIISGICHRLQAFLSMQVSHVRREENKPAHILAQYAKGLDTYVTWVEEGPIIIELALAHDVLNLSSS